MSSTSDTIDVNAVVSNQVAPLVIGSCLSFLGTGVVLFLAGQYFARFGGSDKKVFQWIVGIVTLLVLADAASLASWAFQFSVAAMADPSILNELLPEASVYCFATGLVVGFTQTFYAIRVWILSGKTNHVLLAVLLLLAAGGLAAEFALGAFDLTHSKASDIVQAEPILLSWCAIVTLNDCAITAAMWYYVLWKPRHLRQANMSGSYSPFARIINRAVQTNTISLVTQTFTIILIGAIPHKLWYGLAAWMGSKVYAGSLIATLNLHGDPDSPSGGFDSSRSASARATRKHAVSRHTQLATGGALDDNAGTGAVPTFIYVHRDVETVVATPTPGELDYEVDLAGSEAARDSRFATEKRVRYEGDGYGGEEKGEREESWEMEKVR